MNEPVSIRLDGLAAHVQVRVFAKMQLAGNWASDAVFLSNKRGEIRFDEQAPIEGTYKGVNGMGLFFGMRADMASQGNAQLKLPDIREPVLTTFRAEQDGTTIATAEYRRWWMKPEVRVSDVRDDGLVGTFFEPPGAKHHPALIVLSGSEGGIDQYQAAGLAAKGYAVLALAYFRMESLPKELVNIPIEYFLKGAAWLRRQRSVDSARIGVVGKSRSAEVALLLASFSPNFKVAVAYAPSSVSWAGVGPHNADKPAWMFRGEPVPFVPNTTTAAMLRAGTTAAAASIPIERSRAAVFLVSGREDKIWPPGATSVMGDLVIERLKQANHPYAYEHHAYADAGHTFGMFFLPGPILASGGGTPEGNAKAVADSTPRLFAFLRQHL